MHEEPSKQDMKVTRNFNVDDYLGLFGEMNTAKERVVGLTELLLKGGFRDTN